MQDMKLVGLRQMEMRETRTPVLTRDHDVLIKIARVGICGSDVHYFAEGGIGTQRVRYPWTVGHEGSGTVDRIGPSVSRVKPGDRIAFDPAISCGVCDQCKLGRRHTCRSQKFLGCPQQIEGALAEFLVLPERNCYPIPGSMTFDEAVVIEPLSIAVYAVLLSSRVAGGNIGVLGAGPIGLSVLLAAKSAGCARAYVTDKIEARVSKASEMGADWSGNPNSVDVVREISTQVPDLLDVIFECSGEQDAIDQGIQLLKPGGELLLIGIPGASLRISFDISLLRRKEIRIQNVRRQNECVQTAIDLIARNQINIAPMITHHLSLCECQAGFDMVTDYRDGVVKAIVSLDNE